MATTTNYGWTTPDDTALVKDGAAAIRSLGSAIDTSLNTALGTKKSGLVLLNTTSFSAVASQSINSVFTSNYRNYMLAFNGTITTGTDVQFRLRKSGTDASGANYYFNVIEMISNSSTVTGGGSDGNTLFRIAKGTNTIESIGAMVNVLAPQDSNRRTILDSRYSFYNNTRGEQGQLQCLHNILDSYDGFTLIASAGSITGTVSVYGYNI